MKRAVAFRAVLAGTIGAAAEALLLYNLLAHALPYREFTYPPAAFFSALGVAAPGLALVACLLLGRWLYVRRPLLSPAPMLVLMPAFAGVLAVSTTVLVFGFRVPPGVVNFDRYTLERLGREFAQFVGTVCCVGGLAGVAVSASLAGLDHVARRVQHPEGRRKTGRN